MENVNTLDHLLQIESKAAALVSDAQEEADRRIQKSEEENRASYEERYKQEAQAREASLKKDYEQTKNKYKEALSEYQNDISKVKVNTALFCDLFDKYLDEL